MFLWWGPYAHFVIKTKIPPAEVVRRVRAQVQPPSWQLYTKIQKPYEGRVTDNRFVISKNLRWSHDSMLPVIKGEARERGTGAFVEIRMRPPALTVALGLVWSVLVAGVICESSIAAFGPALLISAMAYVVITAWFDLEVISARDFLFDLLRTRETDAGNAVPEQ